MTKGKATSEAFAHPATRADRRETAAGNRTLITAINVAENIAAPVPHRQFVWTMPKRFRL